jgi:adenylate kinase
MAPKSFEVVYLTGAPAAGKSTVSQALRKLISPLAVFEYGQRLTEYLNQRDRSLNQDDLRAQSAGIIRPEDVEAVDRYLLDFVAEERRHSPF